MPQSHAAILEWYKERAKTSALWLGSIPSHYSAEGLGGATCAHLAHVCWWLIWAKHEQDSHISNSFLLCLLFFANDLFGQDDVANILRKRFGLKGVIIVIPLPGREEGQDFFFKHTPTANC